MAKIMSIGGGDIREKSTLQIDLEIISFSGKKNPKLLFIPTASSDAMENIGKKRLKKIINSYH